MTADEKHISKLAGDMKYDKEHHGSPAKKHFKPQDINKNGEIEDWEIGKAKAMNKHK